MVEEVQFTLTQKKKKKKIEGSCFTSLEKVNQSKNAPL